MSEKPSKFSAILKNRSADTDSTVSVPVESQPSEKVIEKTAPKAPVGRVMGAAKSAKSKNPDYVQVTAYIPAAVRKAAKINLLKLSEDKDFSELLAELLIAWNSKRSTEG
jgi:hypothetical protein